MGVAVVIGSLTDGLLQMTNPLSSTQSPVSKRITQSRDAVSYLIQASSAIIDQGEEIIGRQALAKAYSIALCNDKSNRWKGVDVVNRESGECFDADGKFYRCNNRLCFDCLASYQRRNRKKIRDLMKTHRQQVGYDYRFITFTVVNHGLSLQENRHVIERTWQLFRKRKYFIKNFRAGVKCEEFTFTTNGFHYHIHMIADTRYLMFAKLRAEWTDCYIKVANQLGLDCSIANADGLLSVNVKKIYDLKSSLHEVTKYITKASTWERVDIGDLVEYATLARHPRMIEFFGSWRSRSESLSNEDAENVELNDESSNIAILDKESLSDGTYELLNDFASVLSNIHQKSVEIASFRVKQIRFKNPQAILSYKQSDGYAERIRNLCLIASKPRFSDSALKPFAHISIFRD